MRVEITQTTPLFRHPADHGVFLQWTVDDPPLTDLRFRIERSGSPAGPYDVLFNKLDAFHFFDKMRRLEAPAPGAIVEDLNYLSLARSVYYRVTAISADGISAFDIADVGVTLPKRQLLLKRKMQKDLAITFKFNGVDVAILKRRHWGTRCVACFDRATRKIVNSKCPHCYATGFMGGYFSPVRIMGRFMAPNSETQLVPQGKSDTTQIRFICGQQPIVDPDDILVEIAQNRRYLVIAQTETQLRRETVHQSIIASELARDSVEYKIPANWDHHPVIY
jgi:hypothetical protein